MSDLPYSWCTHSQRFDQVILGAHLADRNYQYHCQRPSSGTGCRQATCAPLGGGTNHDQHRRTAALATPLSGARAAHPKVSRSSLPSQSEAYPRLLKDCSSNCRQSWLPRARASVDSDKHTQIPEFPTVRVPNRERTRLPIVDRLAPSCIFSVGSRTPGTKLIYRHRARRR